MNTEVQGTKEFDERFSRDFNISSSMLNENGHLTLSACQRMTLDAMEKKMLSDHEDVPYLIAHYGISWVMLSMTAEFLRPICPGEHLKSVYLASSRGGFIFRRDAAMLDDSGQTVMRMAIFFGVMNVAERKLLRGGNLMDSLKAQGDQPVFPADSRTVYHLTDFQESQVRRVYPSWLDELGHVNNKHYGDMAYDAMTSEERKSLGKLKRYEAYFLRELHVDDVVSVRRRETPDGVELVGVSENEGFESFFIRCKFKDDTNTVL